MKCCNKCGETRPLFEFYKRADSPDGYRSDCKDCVKKRTKARYFNTLDSQKAYYKALYRRKIAQNPDFGKEKYAAQKDRLSFLNKLYYQRDRDKRIARSVQWAKENKAAANANKKAYKAAKIRACPSWVRENEDYMWMMQQAYELAALRTETFGFSWHVDHIVPLRAKEASGLHAPWNLAVIPGSLNCSKQNKLEFR